MAEYIERGAAIAYIKENQCERCSDIGLCGKCAVLSAVKLFESVPAADVVARKTGKWCADYDYAERVCHRKYTVKRQKLTYIQPYIGTRKQEE